MAERAWQQRLGRSLLPVVVEATEAGLSYHRVGVQDGAHLSRGLSLSYGFCRERPRVLFGHKEGWWFFLHTLSESTGETDLHFAADSFALREEWRDYFESLSSAAELSALKKTGVLWMKRKDDKGWTRHLVVATGHHLEWLAMDGKVKEIAYWEMAIAEDEACHVPAEVGAETTEDKDYKRSTITAPKEKGPSTHALNRKTSPRKDSVLKSQQPAIDLAHPLNISSKRTKRKHIFVFESEQKASSWLALLQERIAAAAACSQATQAEVKNAGSRTLRRRDQEKKSPKPGPLFDPGVEETLERTTLRNSIRDDCERAKEEMGKTPFGLLWDVNNPDHVQRITESKKAPSGHYRILSLDGGGLRAILECVILERLLDHYPDLMERVDLFAGVSGGSMVCCGLACGYSPKFVRSCFEKYGDFIVPQKMALNDDDGKRNLAGIGAKARYPNHNFRIVGTEMLQNLPLRGVPKRLLIPSFLLDNGDDGDRSWEPRVYHNIPRKVDPYERARRSSAHLEKEKQSSHHFGLFSWYNRADREKDREKDKERDKESKLKKSRRKRASLRDRSASDGEEVATERPPSPADEPLGSLPRRRSSDTLLSTLPLSTAVEGKDKEKEKEKEKERVSVKVKKLWKTWKDEREKAKEKRVADLTEEGKGREAVSATARKEGRLRRMMQTKQKKGEEVDDDEDDERSDGDHVVPDKNGNGEEQEEDDEEGDDEEEEGEDVSIGEDVYMKAPVWDYVMASSAAPIVFPSFKKHIDSGVMCNAPGLTAAVTVMSANMQSPQRAQDICVLSLGTGKVNKYIDGLEHDWGLLEWRTTFPELLFKAKDLLSEQLCDQLLGDRYHRINPWLKKKVAMDDPSVIPRLVAIAQSADLTETLAWVARYFYTEEEAEERRLAWRLHKRSEATAGGTGGGTTTGDHYDNEEEYLEDDEREDEEDDYGDVDAEQIEGASEAASEIVTA